MRGEPLEHIRAERRRRGDGDPRHVRYLERTSRGRSWAIASRRDSGSVRSMISVPSRWSSSCCTTRADSPRARGARRSRAASNAVERDLDGALDGHPDRPEREAALLVDLGLLAADGEHRVDDDAILVLVVEDEEPPQDADLRRGEPDALGVVHERRSSARRAGRAPRRTPRPRWRASAAPGRRTGGSATSAIWRRAALLGAIVRRSCSWPVVVVVVITVVVIMAVLVVVIVIVAHAGASLTAAPTATAGRRRRPPSARAGAARGSRPQQRRRAPGERARLLRLRDELGPVAAPQPQQRRRPEQGRVDARRARRAPRAAPARRRPASGPDATIATRWLTGG